MVAAATLGVLEPGDLVAWEVAMGGTTGDLTGGGDGCGRGSPLEDLAPVELGDQSGRPGCIRQRAGSEESVAATLKESRPARPLICWICGRRKTKSNAGKGMGLARTEGLTRRAHED